jgi:hypothetical protein
MCEHIILSDHSLYCQLNYRYTSHFPPPKRDLGFENVHKEKNRGFCEFISGHGQLLNISMFELNIVDIAPGSGPHSK